MQEAKIIIGPDLFLTLRVEFKKLKKFYDFFLKLTFQNGHCVLKAVKLAKRNRFIISSSMFVYPVCINKESAKGFVIYSGEQQTCEIHKLLNVLGQEKIRTRVPAINKTYTGACLHTIIPFPSKE